MRGGRGEGEREEGRGGKRLVKGMERRWGKEVAGEGEKEGQGKRIGTHTPQLFVNAA